MFERVDRYLRPDRFYRIDLEIQSIRSFVMFMGFGRSGHSVVGQVLNAHPNALVADEAPIFDELGASPSMRETVDYLVRWDQAFALKGYNKDSFIRKNEHLTRLFSLRGKARNFRFPGLLQGYVQLPSLLGNSKAGYTSRYIAEQPEVVSSFETAVGVPLKFICILRNPFDMIASGVRRRGASFDEIASNFEQMAQYVESSLATLVDHEVLMLRQEDFLLNVEASLERIFDFLELPLNTEYKKIVQKRLFAEPSKTRYKVPEIEENKSRIQRLIDNHQFFAGYSYQS